MSTIGLMILAAGASTRMGTSKQLLPFQGRSLLRHMSEVAIASCCEPVVVVTGSQADRVKLEVGVVHIVENGQWTAGLGTSIQAGLTKLMSLSRMDAVIIALCDQSLVTSRLLNQLVKLYQISRSPITACAYADTLGVPALFSHELFAELLQLNADVGARYLIQRYFDQVHQLPFPEGAVDNRHSRELSTFAD